MDGCISCTTKTTTRHTTKKVNILRENYEQLLEHLDAKLLKSLPELTLIFNLLQPVPSSNRLAREKDRWERSMSIRNLSQNILDAVALGYFFIRTARKQRWLCHCNK